MPGQKGMRGARPGEGTATVEGVRFGRPSDLTIRTEIGRCLDHNPISIPSRRILEASRKRGTIAICQLPLPPDIERTGASSGDSVARQCTPIGDPVNDEQYSDHLSDPSSHWSTSPEVVVVGRHEPESLRGSGRRYPQCRVRSKKIPQNHFRV